jgi:hypothetical protein
MALPLLDLSKKFTDFITNYREFLAKQGDLNYNPENFKRYVPPEGGDVVSPDKLAAPTDTSDLTLDARKLVQEATADKGNEADYMLLSAQHDIMTSFNRAYAQRYKSKLRHFAHGAAAQKRLSDPDGVLQYGIVDMLTAVRSKSSDSR